MSICGVISTPLGQRTLGRPIAPRRMASCLRQLLKRGRGQGIAAFEVFTGADRVAHKLKIHSGKKRLDPRQTSHD